MCWMMVIMTMRFIWISLIIVPKEAGGRLWGVALFAPNIYIDKNVWQTFTFTIQRSLQHKASFGGYFDVIIITTKIVLHRSSAKKGFETNWCGQVTTREGLGWLEKKWANANNGLSAKHYLTQRNPWTQRKTARHLSKLFKTHMKLIQEKNINAFLNLESVYDWASGVIVGTDKT